FRVGQDIVAEHAGAARDMADGEFEVLLDELAQRIGPEPRIVVDFGDARFVEAGAGEVLGDDLAAETPAPLIDRDLAGGARLVGELPGRKHPARPTADDGDPK